MADVIALCLVAACFALGLLYVRGCDRLRGARS
jgi:hypothetical protein